MDTLVTYSILSLIKEKQSHIHSLIDIFKELCESILFDLQKDTSGKGLITDLKNEFETRFSINIPYPTLKIILKKINAEQGRDFDLFSDFSFTYSSSKFKTFDLDIQSEKNSISELKEVYEKLCNESNIQTIMGIEFFIDVNRKDILHYLNDEDFIIDGNLEFPIFQTIYSLDKYKDIIDRLILGSIISTYVELDAIDFIAKKSLLFDTNFIISLLDLHSVESKLNCDEIISIANKYKYDLWVLPETLQEVRNLLKKKAETVSKINIFVSQDLNTIEHGCYRRNISGSDLELISTKLEKILLQDQIHVVSKAENRRLFEKAPSSDIYQKLKDRPFNQDGIIHDVMAQLFVRSLRKKDEEGFSETSAFFVTDTHGYVENKITSKTQLPYIIRAEELLNILWLLNPTNNSIISRANISRVFSLFIDRKLPGRDILNKLDRRIRGIQSVPIDIQDCVNIAVNLSVLDSKELEELYSIEEDSALKEKLVELSIIATKKKDIEIQEGIKSANQVIAFLEEKKKKETYEKEKTKATLVRRENELAEKKKEINIRELRLKVEHLTILKERDEEELKEIDDRLITLGNRKDKRRNNLSISLACLITISIIVIGIIYIIPNWDMIEPIHFIFVLIEQ